MRSEILPVMVAVIATILSAVLAAFIPSVILYTTPATIATISKGVLPGVDSLNRRPHLLHNHLCLRLLLHHYTPETKVQVLNVRKSSLLRWDFSVRVLTCLVKLWLVAVNLLILSSSN